MIAEPISRKEQKLLTREALKAAAKECFAELGYSVTQISNITDRAGVAKGTFYVHFNDKDEILNEWLAEFNEALVQRLLSIVDPESPSTGDLKGDIERIAEIFLDHWNDNRAFVRAFAEKAAGGVDVASLQQGVNPPMQAFLMVALDRLAEQRGAKVESPELVIQGLLAMWQRLGLQYLFNPAVTRQHALTTLVALSHGALEGAFAQASAKPKRTKSRS